jgi:hypothetical protein
MGVRAEEDGTSKGHAVMAWIEVKLEIATIPHAQASRLPSGLSSQENLRNRHRRKSRWQ